MKKDKKKIVILGGGFGGLYTYKSLCTEFKNNELDITIVNRNNYFLFTPLLHEVATGSIGHYKVVESLRQIIYRDHTKLHIAELLAIDCEKKIVKTSINELPYDILVVSLGATTNFFNAPGAQENSFVLKDLSDALKIRDRLIDSFEKASEIVDIEERKKMLSFAVVGGGSTGVELVSEIAGLFSQTFYTYYKGVVNPSDVSLHLINQGSDVLAPFHKKLRDKALVLLKEMGVNVLLNTGVKEVKKDGIVMNDDSFLQAHTVIWTAGVKSNTPIFSPAVASDKWGRISVNSSLQIPGLPEVFVLGDMASLVDEKGMPLPMLAQVASSQGQETGKNIKRLLSGKKLVPFVYKSKGQLASIGRYQALADIGGIRFSGFVAWFIWRTVYLFKFISLSKKIKIMVDWTMNLFYPHDITRA